MSGLTLSEIREALAAQLVANLSAETNVSIRGEAKPPPVITIRLRRPPDYWGTFGASGLAMVPWELEIDPGGNDESSVRRLDDYLSVGTGNNSSVLDALMTDKTLGLTGCTAMVPDDADGSIDHELMLATLAVDVHIKKVGATV